MDEISGGSYPSLVQQLVKSLVKDVSAQAECSRNVHKAVLQFGDRTDEEPISSAALLHEKIFVLNQHGDSDRAAKLLQLFSELEQYDRNLWDSALKLLCLLAFDLSSDGHELKKIGESCRDDCCLSARDDRISAPFSSAFTSHADYLWPRVQPYSDPDTRHFHVRRGTELVSEDASAGLVSLYPGSGLKRAFSNSEENNLMGAACLQPPPFSSLLRGRFVLDVPDLPSHPRPLATTSSFISTTSTGLSLEDEGYSTRPTTPSVKPVEKVVDWEAAASSEDGRRVIVRKVNPYQLKLMRNQVDVYVDDAFFSRCVRCLLNGLQSELFNFDCQRGTFVYPPRVSLVGVRIVIFQRFCQSLISVGNCVRELNYDIDEAKITPGTVKEFFWRSLRMQLDELLGSVPDFSKTKSLVRFTAFSMGVYNTVKLFCYLARVAKSDGGGSLGLLSEISQAINLLTINDHMRVCLQLLISCCDPLMKLFGAWLYGRSDCQLEGLKIKDGSSVPPLISQSVLDSLQKIGQSVELLRSVFPAHELVDRNRSVPAIRVLTSDEDIAECEAEVEKYVKRHESIFVTNLSLDDSLSPELELAARETRRRFFERVQEEKRLNDEIVRERKAKELEEKKKAMNEEIERKKEEKASYKRDTQTTIPQETRFNDDIIKEIKTKEFEGKKEEVNVRVGEKKVERATYFRVMSTKNSINVTASIDNADVINANVSVNANVTVPIAQGDNDPDLNVTAATMYESFVSQCEIADDEKIDETLDDNDEKIEKNTDETVFENAETLEAPEPVGDVCDEEVKLLVDTCNKELRLESQWGDVTPYSPLRLKSEVLGLSRQAPVIVSLDEFRNTFVNASDMIERSLLPHLSAQSKLVNRAVINAIVCEHQLNEHIRGLRRFFLLYDGEFAAALSTTLEQVGQVQSSAGVLALSSSLRHVLSQSIYGNTLAAGHLTLRVHAEDQSVRLSYRAPWPISIILNDEVLHKYSKVNSLLLDLRRKSALMDKGLWKIFKAGRFAEDARRVSVIASSVREASHVLNAIRRYFHCQAIEIGWNNLNKEWETIQNLDDLFRVHSRYIDGVINRCLLMDSASTIKKVVDQVTSACVDVVRTGLDFLEGQPEKELVFMDSFRKFRDSTKVLCIVVKCAASRHKSSYLAMFDLEVDFNNFFKSLKV